MWGFFCIFSIINVTGLIKIYIMKKLLPIFLFFFSVSSMAQMNGSYTVGGSSPDYGNIQQAIDALMANGVDGPTTILIRDGNYPLQLNFGFTHGVSSINRVAIQSENQDSSLVEISYAAAGFSDNWVVHLIVHNMLL